MRADQLPPDRIRSAADDLLKLVRARLPERFYREPPWRLWGTAFVARMAGTVESIVELVGDGRQADTAVLLRTLYEHMVLFAWISIDPDDRLDRWVDDARVEMRKLHNDAVSFGLSVLNQDELERANAATALPNLADQALEVDRHWSARIRGFRAHPEAGPMDVLSVRGLYVAIYRVASRSAHAQPQSLSAYVDDDRYPWVVHPERDDRTFMSFLALPVFALALLVCNYRFGWPDDDAVKEISDGLLHDVDEA